MRKRKLKKQPFDLRGFLKRRIPFLAIVLALGFTYYHLVYSKNFHSGDCVAFNMAEVQKIYALQDPMTKALTMGFMQKCGGLIYKIKDVDGDNFIMESSPCLQDIQPKVGFKILFNKVSCQ